MVDVWLVRHGQSKANALHITQGQSDVSLSDDGREQVTLLTGRLAKQSFQHIYVSDLQRTRETVEPLIQLLRETATIEEPAPPVEYLELIREKAAGIYEGQPLGSVKEAALQAGIGEREFKPEGGESWLEVCERADAFLKHILKRHAPKTEDQPGLPILVITHGGFIKEFFNVCFPPKQFPNFSTNTAIHIVSILRTTDPSLDINLENLSKQELDMSVSKCLTNPLGSRYVFPKDAVGDKKIREDPKRGISHVYADEWWNFRMALSNEASHLRNFERPRFFKQKKEKPKTEENLTKGTLKPKEQNSKSAYDLICSRTLNQEIDRMFGRVSRSSVNSIDSLRSGKSKLSSPGTPRQERNSPAAKSGNKLARSPALSWTSKDGVTELLEDISSCSKSVASIETCDTLSKAIDCSEIDNIADSPVDDEEYTKRRGLDSHDSSASFKNLHMDCIDELKEHSVADSPTPSSIRLSYPIDRARRSHLPHRV